MSITGDDRLADCLKRMRECANGSERDPEMAHVEADGILVQTIEILAERLCESEVADEITKQFYEVYRWYA